MSLRVYQRPDLAWYFRHNNRTGSRPAVASVAYVGENRTDAQLWIYNREIGANSPFRFETDPVWCDEPDDFATIQRSSHMAGRGAP